MTTGSTCLRGVRIAAALFVLAFTVTGCGRPPDEVWLRCLGFQQSAETISVLEGELNDETSSTVDIELENSSLIVGSTTGTGILVNRTRIDYRMSGFSPPSADYPVSLYLQPPAESAPTTGTLTAFPLASKSLKQWLIDAGVSDPVVELTAHVTIYGLTDEGTQVETEASLGIALTNAGGTGGTKSTVTIDGLRDVSRADSGATGAFTLSRSGGDLTINLTVFFDTSTTGPLNTTNYTLSPMVIPALSNAIDVELTPTASGSGTQVGTVTITLRSNASYHLGNPKSAHIEITD